MRIYNDTLPNVAALSVTTFYKNPIAFGFPSKKMFKINILTHAGGICTCTIGDDSFVQTITEDEALAYINAEGGFSLTP